MASATENRRINIFINGSQVRGAMKDIRAQFRKARAQLEAMDESAEGYNAQLRKVQALNAKIQQHNNKLYGTARAWRQIKSVMTGVIGGNLATTVIQRLLSAIPNVAKANVELSDTYADVQKTTGLTNLEMEELDARLRKLNTRTANKRLLELAATGGKLGKRGVTDIARFVEAVDQIEVALGDDLGDDAALKIEKIADIFDTETLNIGSGINALSDNTKANAGFLTEWLARLAGASKEVGILAGDVLGYGTTLDELGLKVEMSSTALNGFLIDFTKNSEKYGKAAGFANGELSKLIGVEGTNAGFLAFLERLRETSKGSDDFLRKLEQIGITGDRGSQVFLALSQNVDQLRSRQALANREIEKGTSLTNEFSRKNDNAAGNLEKVYKWVQSIWMGGALKRAIDSSLSSLAKWVEVPLSDTMDDQRVAMLSLQLQINSTNISAEKRVKLINQLKKLYPEYLKNIDADTVSNERLNKAIEQVNDTLVNKIVLQRQDERIQEKAQEAAELKDKLLRKEEKMRKNLIRIAEKEGIAYSKNLDVIQLYNRVRDEQRNKHAFQRSNINFVGGTPRDIEFMRGFVENAEQELQNALEQRKKLERRLFGEQDDPMARYYEKRYDRIGKANKQTTQEIQTSSAEQLGLLERIDEQLKDANEDLQNALSKKAIQASQDRITALQAERNYLLGMYDDLEPEEDLEVTLLPDVAANLEKQEEAQRKLEELRRDADDFLNRRDEAGQQDRDDIDAGIPKYETQMEAAVAYYEDLYELAKEHGYREQEIEEQLIAARKNLRNAEFQEKVQKFQQFYDAVTPWANLFLQQQMQRDQRQLDGISTRKNAEIDAINERLANEQISEQQASAQRKKVNDKYRKKEAQIKVKQFKRQQNADIIQSIINTALAISRNAGNPLQAALAGSVGAAQTATIASQPVPQFKFGTTGTHGRILVGEQGPEILNVPRNTEVINNSRTQELLDAGSTPTFSGSVQPSESSSAEIRKLRADIQKLLAGPKSVLFSEYDYKKFQDKVRFSDGLVNLG